MRVAFVTPLHERSAIAQVSLQVIDALNGSWEIELWYPVCDRPRYTSIPTVPFVRGDSIVGALADYDLVIFVLGDSPYHVEILRAAERLPGLVIMHDEVLTNVFERLDELYATRSLEIAALASGSAEAVRSLETHVCAPEAGEGDLAELLPMTDVALRRSLGVVTHSWHAAERLRRHTAGLVSVAPLPVRGRERALPRIPGDDVVVVVAGLVNANKRVDRLINAIAASDLLRRTVRLRVVGACSVPVRETLMSAALEAGLADRVELTGSLSRSAYEAALDSADAFACLRDPVLEAGSASLLEEMATGRPVLVYDHGHYAELPDDAVVKVGIKGGERALIAGLESLVNDPRHGDALGARGAAHVRRSNTAEAYADVLVAAAEEALKARSLTNGLRQLGRTLTDLGLNEDTFARETVATAVTDLFLP
jgi:glycosyltransferase involved in cell wall biosynthesis